MAAKRKNKTSPRRKAATADVVGSGAPDAGVPPRWKKHHDRMVRLRNYLINRQDDLVKDAKEEQPAFSLHMADAATDSFDRDLTLSRASSGQDLVYEIDQALDRIRDGAYGICELTGKPIERARLEAIPWTRFSLDAEMRLEKEGVVCHNRLAPRETVTRGTAGESEPEGAGGEE